MISRLRPPPCPHLDEVDSSETATPRMKPPEAVNVYRFIGASLEAIFRPAIATRQRETGYIYADGPPEKSPKSTAARKHADGYLATRAHLPTCGLLDMVRVWHTRGIV